MWVFLGFPKTHHLIIWISLDSPYRTPSFLVLFWISSVGEMLSSSLGIFFSTLSHLMPSDAKEVELGKKQSAKKNGEQSW